MADVLGDPVGDTLDTTASVQEKRCLVEHNGHTYFIDGEGFLCTHTRVVSRDNWNTTRSLVSLNNQLYAFCNHLYSVDEETGDCLKLSDNWSGTLHVLVYEQSMYVATKSRNIWKVEQDGNYLKILDGASCSRTVVKLKSDGSLCGHTEDGSVIFPLQARLFSLDIWLLICEGSPSLIASLQSTCVSLRSFFSVHEVFKVVMRTRYECPADTSEPPRGWKLDATMCYWAEMIANKTMQFPCKGFYPLSPYGNHRQIYAEARGSTPFSAQIESVDVIYGHQSPVTVTYNDGKVEISLPPTRQSLSIPVEQLGAGQVHTFGCGLRNASNDHFGGKLFVVVDGAEICEEASQLRWPITISTSTGAQMSQVAPIAKFGSGGELFRHYSEVMPFKCKQCRCVYYEGKNSETACENHQGYYSEGSTEDYAPTYWTCCDPQYGEGISCKPTWHVSTKYAHLL